MAQFMGTVRGSRGEESRLGTKSSGMITRCMSYDGVVHTVMWHNELTGKDHVRVTLAQHPKRGGNHIITLYDGPCSGEGK